MQFEAVFFDLDGTLVNSLFDLTDGVNITMKHLGFPSRTTEEVMSFVGDGILKTIMRSVPKEKAESVDFKKAEDVNTNTQLYKQAGNSIVVNILEGIIKQLIEEGNEKI